MICHACGVEAPTKYVAFYQNIGALVVRFSKSVEGHLCKGCVHKHFWSLTSTTFVLGWWGTISFIVTPFFLLNNMVRYAGCLAMPAVPPGAQPPVLTDDVIERIGPHAEALFDRLGGGEPLKQVAADVADLSDTTPGQVILFAQAVIESQKRG